MTLLLRITLAFVLGLVPGLLLPGVPGVGPPTALVVAGAAIAAATALTRADWRPRAAPLLFVLLGALAGLEAAGAAGDHCFARLRHGQRAALSGFLEAEPVPGRAAAFQASGECSGSLRVQLPRGGHLRAGEPLHLSGRWVAFEETTRWPLPPERQGMLRVQAARSAAAAAPGPLLSARLAAQRAFRESLPRQHGMAEALVLARREALDPSIRDAFVAAGMAHLLAISGSHVLVFAGALLLLLRIARVPLRLAQACAVLGIGVYVLSLGAVPPALRAALQFTLLSASILLQRPAHRWSLLAAAALVLLVLDPLHALDAGFQLSFAGVAGLLAFRRPLLGACDRRLPRWLADPLATGVAATVATAPIAALHFGQFAPIGLLASLVAGPLLALALPALALLLLAHAAAPPLALWLGSGIELLLGALLAVARAAAAVPGGHVAVAADTVLFALAAAAAVVLHEVRRRGDASTDAADTPTALDAQRRLRWLRRVRAATLVVCLVAWLPGLAPGRGALELHVIDVGQGDAVALRTPRGRWMLVDAGMRTDRGDMGQRRVVPYLLGQGVRRIDLLVLSHPHADHIGGALAVFRAFDVGTVIDPGAPAASAQLVETLTAAQAEPARWITPRSGAELRLDGVRLRFLHPGAPLLDAPGDPNDLSVVFRLTYGQFAALFTGDATAAVEAGLLADHAPDLPAAVLKVGHHGSRTSSGPDFLATVDPRFAVISVGRDNRYGHPAPDVMARLLRHGVTVLRTDERGSIRIRALRSGEIEVATQR